MGTSVLVQTSICPHPTSSDRVACLCAYWWPCPTLPKPRTQSGAPEKSTTTAVGRLRASFSVDCSLITCLETGIFFGSPPSLVLLDKLPKKTTTKSSRGWMESLCRSLISTATTVEMPTTSAMLCLIKSSLNRWPVLRRPLEIFQEKSQPVMLFVNRRSIPEEPRN